MKSAILVSLMLAAFTLPAAAQRSKGAFLTNSTGFDYSAGDFTGHIVFRAQTPTAPTQNSAVWLYLETWDPITGAWVYATGNVPGSVMKVTGQSITIDIPDLRDLSGPTFTLQYSGLTDFSVQAMVTTTSAWQQKSTSNYQSRTLQADGTYAS